MSKSLLEKHKEKIEEIKLAAMIWWLIIWYASDEGEIEIPSEHEWLSSELVAALYEELTGKEFWYANRYTEENEVLHHNWDEWPVKLNAAMEECFIRSSFTLSSDIALVGHIRKLLKEFVRYEIQHERDDRWFSSDLKWYHENRTPTYARHSRFKPHHDMAIEATSELLRWTSEHHADVCQWCRGIGAIMKKYIQRDMGYIRRHYSW